MSGVLNLFDLLAHMKANIALIRSPSLSAQLSQQLRGLHDQMLLYRLRHERGEDMQKEAHSVYREMQLFDQTITKHLKAQNEHERLLNLVNFKPNNNNSNHNHNHSNLLVKPIPTTLLQQQQHAFQQQQHYHSNQQPLNGLSTLHYNQHQHTNGHGAAIEVIDIEQDGRRDGEKEARKEKKRKRKEGRDRTAEEDDERRARKKKRRETEDTEARERRKRKKDKHKARQARKKAHEKQEREKDKKRRKKHKHKHQHHNGHATPASSSSSSSSSSSASSSSASDSSDASSDDEPLSKKRTPLAAADREQTVQALIASMHSKREQKQKKEAKDSSRKRQLTEPEAMPAATLTSADTPAIAAITTSYRPPAFNVMDFAEAFQHITPPPTMPTPFPPPTANASAVGQLICPPQRHSTQPLPSRADDDAGVIQRSALLSAFSFAPSSVRRIMQGAMPADGECSEEAVQLVVQSVCQFIAYITDEAETDIEMVDEKEEAVVEELDEDELPLSHSLRLPLPDRERAKASRTDSLGTVPSADIPHAQSNSAEITSEKVLTALLRLGYDDYAVLSAHHLQRYRREQQQLNSPLSPLPRVTGRGGGSSKEALPTNLSSSYLLDNAHRIDMSAFLPSIPRHPVSDPRIELSVSSSTLSALPSSSTSSSSTHVSKAVTQSHKPKRSAPASAATSAQSSPSTTPRSATDKPAKRPYTKKAQHPVDPTASGVPSPAAKKPRFDPTDPFVSEASLAKSAQSKAAWAKKRALMETGLTREEATERLKAEAAAEKEEARRLRMEQKAAKSKKVKQPKQQRLLHQPQQPQQQQQAQQTIVQVVSDERERKDEQEDEPMAVRDVAMTDGSVDAASVAAPIAEESRVTMAAL